MEVYPMGREAIVTEKGFTAIEFLIYASIIALLISFAAPMVSSSIRQSQVDQAMEITEESIKQARRTARIYNTEVLMHIVSDGQPGQDAITLSIPDFQRDTSLNSVTEEFALPTGVDIQSTDAVIYFDPAGEVDWPTMIVFTSPDAGDNHLSLLVE